MTAIYLHYLVNANVHTGIGFDHITVRNRTHINNMRFLRRFQGDATKPGKDLTVTSSYAIEAGTGQLAMLR